MVTFDDEAMRNYSDEEIDRRGCFPAILLTGDVFSRMKAVVDAAKELAGEIDQHSENFHHYFPSYMNLTWALKELDE